MRPLRENYRKDTESLLYDFFKTILGDSHFLKSCVTGSSQPFYDTDIITPILQVRKSSLRKVK